MGRRLDSYLAAANVKAFVITVVVAIAVVDSRPALAQEKTVLEVNDGIDGALTAAALAATLALLFVPVEQEKRWDTELLGSLDKSVRDNFSPAAADVSDVLLATSLVAPLLVQVQDGFDKESGQQALVYGETLAASILLNTATKYAIQRPRPYLYNPSPKAKAYAAKQGDDAYLSFYSGHASTAFSGAIAGSILYAQDSTSKGGKVAMWGAEMGLASATAMLRVRAGKHYYSDVLVGILIGSAIGVLVPALHTTGSAYEPSDSEWASMAAGVAIGALVGQFLPLADDSTPESATRISRLLRNMQLMPLATGESGGLSLSASF
jgi:hypothetical protein